MHVYVEIDVLGRYSCVYERVCMDLDHMAWYISFPLCLLQTLVVTMRVRSLFKITSGRSSGARAPRHFSVFNFVRIPELI